MVKDVRVREIIFNAIARIKKEYCPEKIILFGSYAYGKPNKDSDIDLFIIKETRKKRIERFCDVSRLLRDIKGISIQPVVFTRDELSKRLDLEDDFVKEILAKGEVLYESEG